MNEKKKYKKKWIFIYLNQLFIAKIITQYVIQHININIYSFLKYLYWFFLSLFDYSKIVGKKYSIL